MKKPIHTYLISFSKSQINLPAIAVDADTFHWWRRHVATNFPQVTYELTEETEELGAHVFHEHWLRLKTVNKDTELTALEITSAAERDLRIYQDSLQSAIEADDQLSIKICEREIAVAKAKIDTVNKLHPAKIQS